MGIRLDITNDMAKVDEIKILEKLEAAFKQNPNSYLSSLFTTPFTSWASQNIKDDIMVDAMQYIRQNPDEKLMNEIESLRTDLTDAKINCNNALELFDKSQEELKAQQEQNVELTVARNEALKDNDTLQIGYDLLNEEITQLKARLYDLIK